ncbi:MAG: mannose-6-phosphate isomerase [Acidobacteria bacterium]|nr:MAG: mannose-6-phosphate isomerase [Acidobacteriota bacterium]
MNRPSEYDKFPVIRVQSPTNCAWRGWHSILEQIRGSISRGARRLAIECYPGVLEQQISETLSEALSPTRVIRVRDTYKASREIESMISQELTDDPVFGRMDGLVIQDFVDPARIESSREQLKQNRGQLILIVGAGTSLIEPDPDVLIYADLPRWEIQQRQRRNEIGNLAVENLYESPSLKYKRGYFLDWRLADRIKKDMIGRLDFLLDTTDPRNPKLVSGDAFRAALQHAVTRPFRVVPFFDPGPWGGQWMREVCGLDAAAPNYAWCFDCVPEENSLRFGFGDVVIEVPAIDLVFQHPRELLGDPVHERFGAEFPIRFDFLDTMEGGNLSLQVHPLTEYIREKFGIPYAQDESYYLLDAAPDASVYLGLKSNIDRKQMAAELRQAQEGSNWFDAEQYVNKWPARKHDHFLIPAGTIHCSGRNSMVLEISATPYIFTFKLWDWGRPGLDGKPRPIHLDHGLANIQWERDTQWVKDNLINRVCPVAHGEGWAEEKTGLHPLEFIETRRHWFNGPVIHDNQGSVHVLNLVEGDAAVIDSPYDLFEPFTVHYAETFIVPAALGKYRVRPLQSDRKCATIRASVRTDH